MSIYAVVDPATGEQVAEYPEIDAAGLEDALTRVAAAAKGWGRTSTPAERADLLRRVAQLHRDRQEELARIAVREMGKPLQQARDEVGFAADIIDYYADTGPDLVKDQPIELSFGEGDAVIRTSPVGALLGIMPWNFPYYQVARFAAPNLVIGNTILLKHAPQCPESAAAIERMFTDAGFPDGAYVNIYATNEQIEQVIGDPRIQGVSLTGSERAGSAVAAIAGKHLKKVVLELGGSDPFLVLSTDDLDATVEAAVAGRLDNTGQSCNAAKRFVVVDDLYEPFLERFTSALQAVEPSDPSSDEARIGPLSSETAAERLQSQVDRAVEGGARVVLGGKRNGTFFPPTVLVGVTPDNDVYREEFFGPVATVYRVADEDDAVRVANDTPFGLGSYVFTTDREQAERVADRLEAGMVYVNIVGADAPELPFGGTKRSGFGRELGRLGLGEFANRKLIRANAWPTVSGTTGA
ncbi:NAD-dependent succinate-semialdehyde dehydrogenase [Amnibacterium sp. CER49]|uniref:NAD-dependent succinate-semialdehyde dehydrogenase n=1 Tax=Amnibacterium sp. CER49 TaxID=3039161 RepID=UPI00244B7437|nr:NAD-dependent succinate-semialdehyde dehydrogenase [Amnibacterium sp. CER49]MDH2445180.1 NAD-dependent succinate-semialdehyde dehydrogenase [Amnibacterium sp. CER49]